MPIRHDPRTGKFMGMGTSGFKASVKGGGLKSPAGKGNAGLDKMLYKAAGRHGGGFGSLAQHTSARNPSRKAALNSLKRRQLDDQFYDERYQQAIARNKGYYR